MAEIGEEWGGSSRTGAADLPSLEDVQHWTGVIGQAQQMLMEHMAETMAVAPDELRLPPVPSPLFADPEKLADQQGDLIRASLGLFAEWIPQPAGLNGLPRRAPGGKSAGRAGKLAHVQTVRRSVVAAPESASARALTDVAGKLAQRVSILNAE